jgi:hypothetical protein
VSRGKALASGWCPKHDRLYTDAGDRCPDCGTALVPVGSGAPKPRARTTEEVLSAGGEPLDGPARPEPPPPARNPWIVRGAIAAGLIAAFVLGLVFPRTELDPQPIRRGVSISRDVRPRRSATMPAGEIRLDLVTQKGKDVQADFTVFAGFPDPRLIEGASVEVTTDGGTAGESTAGLTEVRLLPGPTGFQITGELEAADEPLVKIRITTLQLRLDETPSWDVDLSRIWPVTRANEPTLQRVGEARPVAEATMRLSSVLGWADRLEAFFDITAAGGEAARVEVGALEIAVQRRDASGTRIGQTPQRLDAVLETVSPTQVRARFEGIPADAGRTTLRATGVRRFLNGPWTWDLP